MIGTKLIHDCERAVRYPVGWVKMVTLLCVWLVSITWKLCVVGVMRWTVPRWTVGLCISPCELIYVIAMC